MEDVELARYILEHENLKLVVVKGGQTLVTSRGDGVRPLFEAIASYGDSLHGAAVADQIVGSAIAMLCLHAQIASVYAGIASKRALAILRRRGVNITSKSVVPHIFNREGTDLCPFEKLARRCRQPSQLLSALESFFAKGDQ